MLALASGLLFGIGLVVAGMTVPSNVIGFLDVTGHWNPNLGAVMAGAIGVHAILLRIGQRRDARSPALSAPPPRRLEPALVGGAAAFGVGWALTGYCPGPSIVSLGFGSPAAGLFGVAMLLGIAFAQALTASHSASVSVECGSPAP